MRKLEFVDQLLTNYWTLLVVATLFALGGLLEGFGMLPLSADDQVARVFALMVLFEGTLVARRILWQVGDIRSRVQPGFDAVPENKVTALIEDIANDVSARSVTFVVSGLRYSVGAVESLLGKGVKVQVVCPDPSRRELFLSTHHQTAVAERLNRVANQGAHIYLSPNAVTTRVIIIKGSSNVVILGWYRNMCNKTMQVATDHVVVRDTRSETGRSLLQFAEGFVEQMLKECKRYTTDEQSERRLLQAAKRVARRWCRALFSRP